MKRIGILLPLLLLLYGCGSNEPMEKAMDLRSRLLTAAGCSFEAEITADYGDSLETFTLLCEGTPQGQVSFTVKDPEPISGITGSLSQEGGNLTFDGKSLGFNFLTDDQLSPVCAPWVFLKVLRGGCLTSACREGERIRVSAQDSFQSSGLLADLWLEPGNLPVRCELLYRNRRILTLEIRDFRLTQV